MSHDLSPGRQALIFTMLVMALGLAMIPLVQAMGEAGLIVYMFTPSLAVMVMLFAVTREGRRPGVWTSLGLRPSGRSYWLVTVVLTVLVAVAGLLVAVAVTDATFVTPDLWYLMPIDLVIQLVLTSLTMVLGEELGWRGYLLPRLRHLGDAKALGIVGVIHGTWHMPIILGTSVDYIDGNRLLIVPLFYATIVGAGFFMGLLRIYSNSVWPATLAHAAHNAAWTLTGSFMAGASITAESYIAGDAGIVIAVGTWLGVAGFWYWHHKRGQNQEQTRVATSAVAIPRPV